MRRDLIKRILTEGLNLSYAPKNIYWEGYDVNLEESLFEYGFVARQPENKDYPDEWFVLYAYAGAFDTGWIRESDLDKYMLGQDWMDEREIQNTLDSRNQTLEEWLNQGFLSKFGDLIGEHGVDNFMGGSYGMLDKNAAIDLLNKHLPPNTPRITAEDEDTLVCPECGSDNIDSDYNYDTGQTDRRCRNCEHEFRT